MLLTEKSTAYQLSLQQTHIKESFKSQKSVHLIKTALKHSKNSVELQQNLEASLQLRVTKRTYFFFDPLPIKILPVNLETRYPLTPRRLAKIYAGLYFTEYFFKINKQNILAMSKGFFIQMMNEMETSL